jgi:tetratricopeptide (TPR) repeat protein
MQRPADQTVAPLVSRAERSREAGDFDTAIPAYAEAFERTPWNTKLKRALAVTHTERAAYQRSNGSLAGAEEDLRAALELYPDDAEFRRGLAVVLLERSSYEADPARAAALRSEARALDTDLAIPEQRVDATLERRMDLAFELLERGQVEAGIFDLQNLRRDYPQDPAVARLLAQALVRRSGEFSERSNFSKARELLDQAVLLYAELLPCDGQRCQADELKVAHYNRIVICVNGGDVEAARAALADAKKAGLSFPDLAAAVERRG